MTKRVTAGFELAKFLTGNWLQSRSSRPTRNLQAICTSLAVMIFGRKAFLPNEKQLAAKRCRELFRDGSRDNKTPLELFLAGIRGWETGFRRRMDDGSSNPD
jgi:hypothetical protein